LIFGELKAKGENRKSGNSRISVRALGRYCWKTVGNVSTRPAGDGRSNVWTSTSRSSLSNDAQL